MKNSSTFIIALLLTTLLYSCSSYSEITIIGEGQQTKDGFYINGYVLTYEEIKKYNVDYLKDDYDAVQLKVIGRVEVYEMDATSETGEIMQAREGKTNFLTNIKSIEIIE